MKRKNIMIKCLRQYPQICNYSSITRVIFAIVIFIFAFNWVPVIRDSTYVWQVNTLAKLLVSGRHECSFSKIIEGSDSSANLKILRDSKPKIAVLSVHGGSWPGNLMKRVAANKEAYCRMHGYDYINGNDYIDRKDGRPVAWFKLPAVEKSLAKYDYVMYIDMDALIMNMNISIEEFVASSDGKDLIMTQDWGGVNTGVWIAKKSAWTSFFLMEAFNQKQLVKERAPDGTPYPFEFEQRAFHYLLNTKKWRSRHLPSYKGDVKSIREHVKYLPQCAFNSYCVHPFDLYKGRYSETQVY